MVAEQLPYRVSEDDDQHQLIPDGCAAGAIWQDASVQLFFEQLAMKESYARVSKMTAQGAPGVSISLVDLCRNKILGYFADENAKIQAYQRCVLCIHWLLPHIRAMLRAICGRPTHACIGVLGLHYPDCATGTG